MFTGPGTWAWGTGSTDYLQLGSSSITAAPILWDAWLANVPQLVLSFCYLCVNTICTSMAAAEEWNNLASHKKGLRVTQPAGSQRSKYFLQLPYRRSLPLMAFSGTLHWLLSQTFFLVRIDFYDRRSVIVESEFRSACDFSTLGLYVLLFAAYLLLGIVGGFGLTSMLTKAPIIASCSLAISASCHLSPNKIDPHLAPVQWGVIEHQVVEGFGHCSLSSKVI